VKFLSLTFRRFGPFDERTLDLSAGNSGMHVILGGNEAGKTTALRGLGYFLFGFPDKKCEEFRYRAEEQRIGGRLVNRSGVPLECYRRRGRKQTLRGPDDRTVVSDEKLAQMLGGLNRDQFNMLFGLGYDRLVGGGREIVEGQGGLGEALFAAGAGLAGLRRIDKQLEQRLGALWRPQGKNQLIAIARREWAEARDARDKAALHIEQYQEQVEARRQAIEQKRQLEETRRAGRLELDWLKSFRAALPTIDALREAEASLQPLLTMLRLRSGFGEDYRKAVQDVLRTRGNRDHAAEALGRLRREAQALPPLDAILAEETRIDALTQELGARVKEKQDRPALELQANRHRERARRLLGDYFGGTELAEANALRLGPAQLDHIRRLGEQRQALQQAVESASNRLAALDRETLQLEHHLAASPPPESVETLATLVDAIASEGPLEAQLAVAEAKLAAELQRAEHALQRLPGYWRGPLADLGTLPLPLSATVAEFQKEFDRLEESGCLLRRQLEEVERTIADNRRAISELVQARKVPTEADLTGARAERDAGLNMVRQEWLGGGAQASERDRFIARHAPGRHLLDALGGSIRHSDDLADRMRHDADRSASLSQLQAAVERGEEEARRLAGRQQVLAQEREELEERWRRAWTAAGIAPRAPLEMAEWLREIARLRDKAEEIAGLQSAAADQRRRIDGHRQRLGKALAASEAGSTLAELVALGRKRVQDAHLAAQERRDLENRWHALQQQREQERQALAHAEKALAAWREQWGRVVQAIKLTADDDPATANDYLDRLTELFHELHEADGLKERMEGMAANWVRTLESVNALRKRLGDVGPPTTQETLESDVLNLAQRLKRARDTRTQREQLEKQLADAEDTLSRAEQELREHEARVEALRQEAAAASADDLPRVIEQAETRQRLEAQIEKERRRLRELAGGQTLECFIEQANAARSNLDDRISRLEDGREALDKEINQQAIAAAEAERQLKAWEEAGDEAAQASQRMELHLARLRDHAAEYATLFIARQALRLTIERYREKNQGTMLSRAEHFFRTLTNGAFQRLDIDVDEEGNDQLCAVRARPEESVKVAGLSDGTRDQLFLSLRLAGIEQHLEKGEPMPLIVDDVLVHFDDERALATLRCLCELSAKTQVLFFTHHRHLVEMAKEHLPAGQVFFHAL